jgi:molecular chaperone GrpE (heat shock protein)
MSPRAEKKLDREISAIYKEHCQGAIIGLMDITKVFDAAKKAHEEGKDMKDTILETVKVLRKN